MPVPLLQAARDPQRQILVALITAKPRRVLSHHETVVGTDQNGIVLMAGQRANLKLQNQQLS